jgi:chemotaxis protein CheZ
MSTVKRHLAEVLIGQGYQDLSGQIIRGVMKLIQELELALSQLLRIVGPEEAFQGGPVNTCAAGGPQIPGIERHNALGDQSDVDALLSQMGV